MNKEDLKARLFFQKYGVSIYVIKGILPLAVVIAITVAITLAVAGVI